MKPKKLVMYLGQRVNWAGEIYQEFKDREGNSYAYQSIKGVYFGEVYPLLPGDKMNRNPKAVETDWLPTEQDRREYEAQKIVVAAKRQERLKAMKIRKPHPDITRAVGLIKPFYLWLNNLERRRFIQWFENECSKKPPKKRKGRR